MNRIRKIDNNSDSFIYMVCSASSTGSTTGVNDMNLKNPTLIGFGIKNNATFSKACQYASGNNIGSQFMREVGNARDIPATVKAFVESVCGDNY